MTIKKFFFDWVIPVFIAIILAFAINKLAFFKIKVPSESMLPTIKIGDQIIVTRVYNTSNLKRGDIVVFYSNELKIRLVKRLVGLPGDKIEINNSGEMYLNGVKKLEPYVVYPDKRPGVFNVPANHFLFMGDNRNNSDDARYWNEPYIDGKQIEGKAQFVVFPFKRFGKFVSGVEGLKH
jgi:signal peptidase I